MVNGLKGRIEKLEKLHAPTKREITIIPIEDSESVIEAKARAMRVYGSLRGCIFATAHDVAL
jgi:hypothetical protein